jgi:hypothetical protein
LVLLIGLLLVAVTALTGAQLESIVHGAPSSRIQSFLQTDALFLVGRQYHGESAGGTFDLADSPADKGVKNV